MELSKKLTILVTPAQHEMLVGEAKRRGQSMGELIREACEKQYRRGGLAIGDRPTVEQRLAAVEELLRLNLPVADVATMKWESSSYPKPEPQSSGEE